MADSLLSASQSFLSSKRDRLDTVTESCGVYHRRWYILAVFSLIAGLQAAAWNTWGPITGSAENVFGWTDGTIALLENWGSIAYIVSFLIFSWLLDVKGVLVYFCSRNLELEDLGGIRCVTACARVYGLLDLCPFGGRPRPVIVSSFVAAYCLFSPVLCGTCKAVGCSYFKLLSIWANNYSTLILHQIKAKGAYCVEGAPLIRNACANLTWCKLRFVKA